MFGFLKDKLKKAADGLKKALSKEEKEEKAEDKAIVEPISEEEKEEIKEVVDGVKEEVAEEDYKALPESEKAFRETVDEKIEEEIQDEIVKVETTPEAEELTEKEKEVSKEVVHEAHEEIEKEREEKRRQEEEEERIQKALEARERDERRIERERKKEEEKREEEALKKEVIKSAPELEKVAEEVEDVIEEIREEIEEEPEELKKIKEQAEKAALEPPKKKGFFEKIFGKKEKKEKKEELEIKKEEKKPEKKKGILSGLFEKKLSETEFEKFFRDLEISLLESNIAFEVIQLVKEKLKEQLVEKQIPRGKTEEILLKTINDTFDEVLIGEEPKSLLKAIKENKKKGEPTKIMFLGVNGVGKTTSLAKMCYWLKKEGHSCVFSASDTFRAASVEQLQKHADKLDVNVIHHKYGGDPAAVAFDAIEHAKSKKIDVVLIDSAGRQHTSSNLMDELKKLKRVAKPDFTIFVADALTGNDAVEQAREFGNQIGFDLIILGKADVDQKGGAILSVSYVSGKPILFLGIGQEYKDLEAFDKEKIIKRLL